MTYTNSSSKFNFLWNYSLTSESEISQFFGFVQYLPMLESKIFIWIVYRCQSQEHDRKKKKKREKNVSIFLAILDKTNNAACFK
jgi:hypothetical protein